jgi:hypothetical protein
MIAATLRRTMMVLPLFCWMMASGQTAAMQEAQLFDSGRNSLYTQSELWRGFDATAGSPGWDADVYRQYIRAGKFSPSPSVARARSLHDDGISTALGAYLRVARAQGREVVAIMGSAREDIRCTDSYRQSALLGYRLAKGGYLVATGGGPGEMEAANLGAYLSNQDEVALDEAITLMRRRADKSPDKNVCRYTSKLAYTEAAFDVIQRFPAGADTLGVPTWFYGHEPPNRFAIHIAKFFSNAIREDMLLSMATGGTVFTEGSAGMRQEIFQKAAQENFASFCYVSPMIFLGTKEFGDSGLYQMVYSYASPAFPSVGSYRDALKLTDSVSEVMAFLTATPTRRIPDAEGTCSNML